MVPTPIIITLLLVVKNHVQWKQNQNSPFVNHIKHMQFFLFSFLTFAGSASERPAEKRKRKFRLFPSNKIYWFYSEPDFCANEYIYMFYNVFACICVYICLRFVRLLLKFTTHGGGTRFKDKQNYKQKSGRKIKTVCE